MVIVTMAMLLGDIYAVAKVMVTYPTNSYSTPRVEGSEMILTTPLATSVTATGNL